jgi:dihydroxyacetone kinase-like protein
MKTAGSDITVATRLAATTAREAAVNTTPLQARKGRASYLGERSIGHQDPGATSTALLLESLAAVSVEA